jgi:hypothetical protein
MCISGIRPCRSFSSMALTVISKMAALTLYSAVNWSTAD